MGELYRRYWLPVAATVEMETEPVKAVRILGEDLVLFRDPRGRYGLVGNKCLHRRVDMVFGMVEDDGLRCPYHGWLYDRTGQCIEQPAEDMEAPDSTFRERVRLSAYPVQELGGLVFAYLGPNPAPLLPRWEALVKGETNRPAIGWSILPCNYLQIMENSLDQTHVEWLHRRFDNYVLQRKGRDDLKYEVRHHEKIGADVFEYGIVKRRMWKGGTEQDPEWRIGHPVLFPNILLNGAQTLQIRVPIDDEHTMHWWYPARVMPRDKAAAKAADTRLYHVPLPGVTENGHPTWDVLDNNLGQDMAMWYTQGGVADRSEEKLGTSDKAIILYRRLLEDNVQKVERGEDPMGVFRDPAQNVCIHVPTEDDEGGIEERRIRSVPGRVVA
jgi:5,5'-dehydrodivanillate O-demethylase